MHTGKPEHKLAIQKITHIRNSPSCRIQEEGRVFSFLQCEKLKSDNTINSQQGKGGGRKEHTNLEEITTNCSPFLADTRTHLIPDQRHLC